MSGGGSNANGASDSCAVVYCSSASKPGAAGSGCSELWVWCSSGLTTFADERRRVMVMEGRPYGPSRRISKSCEGRGLRSLPIVVLRRGGDVGSEGDSGSCTLLRGFVADGVALCGLLGLLSAEVAVVSICTEGRGGGWSKGPSWRWSKSCVLGSSSAGMLAPMRQAATGKCLGRDRSCYCSDVSVAGRCWMQSAFPDEAVQCTIM